MTSSIIVGRTSTTRGVGEETMVDTAFHAGRLVLSVVFMLSFVAFLRGTASMGWSALIAAATCAAGFVLSVTYLISFTRERRSGTEPKALATIRRIPRGLLIAIDSVIALGIILLAGANSAPLAWVALLIPVTETALIFSLAPAAAVWIGLSLAHMSFVVIDSEQSTQLTLALQQLLAVLLVAVPAGIIAQGLRGRIENLTAERERSFRQSAQLETVALAAHRMSGLHHRTDVLREAVESAASIGFEQADVVARHAGAQWTTVSRHHQLNRPPVPEHLLSDAASDSDGVAIVRDDTPMNRQLLHSVQMGWGCAVALNTIGYDNPPVLRAWSLYPVEDETERIRAVSLLAKHVENIHTNAVNSERATAEANRLAFEAAHDRLTGVANHGNIMETIARLLRSGTGFTSVFFVDLDRFKPINDTLGHEAGNQALITISERLKELVGDTGTVGRMGGDEFIVVGSADALAVDNDTFGLASRLHRTICAPMEIDGHHVAVGASVGAAAAGPEVSADELIRRADVAMYAAKRNGGGGLVWDPELETAAKDATPVSSRGETLQVVEPTPSPSMPSSDALDAPAVTAIMAASPSDHSPEQIDAPQPSPAIDPVPDRVATAPTDRSPLHPEPERPQFAMPAAPSGPEPFSTDHLASIHAEMQEAEGGLTSAAIDDLADVPSHRGAPESLDDMLGSPSVASITTVEMMTPRLTTEPNRDSHV